MSIEVFFLESGLTPVYCFPVDTSVLLSQWTTYRKLATESASPNQGRYSFDSGDTYRFWRVFVGSSQPASWEAALPDLLEILDRDGSGLPGVVISRELPESQKIEVFLDVSSETYVDIFALDGVTAWSFVGQEPEISIARLNGSTIAKIEYADITITANRLAFSIPLGIRRQPGLYSFSVRDTLLGDFVIAEGEMYLRYAARRLP